MPEAIQDLEERLRQAMLKGDVDALDQLIDDQGFYTGPDGMVYDKQADLGAHRDKTLKLSRLEPSESHVRELDNVVIVSVKMAIAGSSNGGDFEGDYRYTRVWSRIDGQWRVVAAHCSPIPKAEGRENAGDESKGADGREGGKADERKPASQDGGEREPREGDPDTRKNALRQDVGKSREARPGDDGDHWHESGSSDRIDHRPEALEEDSSEA